MLVKIGLAGAGLLLLVGAGYYGNQQLTCSRLEEDYLNSLSSLKDSEVVLRAIAKPDIQRSFKTINEQSADRMRVALEGLYEHCGQRAVETAARKGSDIILQ